MNKAVKIIIEIILFAAIVALVYAIYSSIMKPVNFNKQKAYRESVAIQRLKDIRTLQVAFKSENGRYLSTVDSLVDFYNNGALTVVKKYGHADDSLAQVHTTQVCRKHGIKINTVPGKKTLESLWAAGDTLLAFDGLPIKTPVRESMFTDRPDFCADSLKYIPFSGGVPVAMEYEARMVSGVIVPLFEARMDYKSLLKGMDNQLRINLDAERKDQNKFEGLQVGSIAAPNNNAGNWE